RVQLAKHRRRRATLPWYARLWGHLQDAAIGYGYRPLRAAAWLLALTLLGGAAFALHHPEPLKPGEAPGFNAFFYTLDLLLPIIDFGQEKAFKPDGWYQWLSYLLVVLGWVLATTVVAGVTRIVSRQ
ncbi:MAG: membrane-associated oxidoreductase, partial [Actinomadura rubrobrunea]|nr:membrane-associated oxidoreductase [Actinomadura rubrobrunea]